MITASYLDVVEDGLKYFLLGDTEMRVVVFWMRAHVDDSVHIQVQVVKLRNLQAMSCVFVAKKKKRTYILSE